MKFGFQYTFLNIKFSSRKTVVSLVSIYLMLIKNILQKPSQLYIFSSKTLL